MRILVAEDDAVIKDGLVQTLRGMGYATDGVNNGNDADLAVAAQQYQLLVLDIDLPKLSGLEVLKRLRARGDNTPVLILTASGSVDDRVKGLNNGADDYMAKPFALAEFEARVRALTRRSAGKSANELRLGELVVDQIGRTAKVSDRVLDLSARELGVLETLLRHHGRWTSKEQLIDELCAWGDEVTSNAIEVYVYRLRKKLEGADVQIATVRGLGYAVRQVANTTE